MISVEQAKGILEKRFPDAGVKSSYMYKDSFYLFLAPDKNADGTDYNDPYYIIDVENGNIRFLNPLEDLEAFMKAMSDNLIKDYSKVEE